LDFTAKKVLVVGAGISGRAAIKVLLSRGADITVCDKKDRNEIVRILHTELADKVTVCSSWSDLDVNAFDLLIVSPGIKPDTEPISTALAAGIPVISEVELAYLIKKASTEIYAVTGTNGKTTTTTLLQEILAAAGKKSAACGNIGLALTTVIDGTDIDIAVAEISSFQLETIKTFRPHICGLLNITPDHIDRHKSMENYIKAKSRIFENQQPDDYVIFNYEDPVLLKISEQCIAKKIFFSTERELPSGVFIKENKIIIKLNGQEKVVCGLEEIKLRGKHNQENVLCAAAMAAAAGIEPRHIAAALKIFKGVRHRLEEVGVADGVLYINDSKGTNPESSIKAIESFNEPLILIAGGRNKGSRFDTFAQAIKKKVKGLILLGEAKEEIKSAVMTTGFTNIYEVEDLRAAIKKAHQLAREGEVVLLSPACASWDMFDNYEQRGDLFCKEVHSLGESKEQ